MSYKLRTTIRGHSLDVRAVAASCIHGAFMTASRDQQCKLWVSSGDGIDFDEQRIFCGHTKYISAVCAMPPSEQHPNGLIVTGGNDSVILIFDPETAEQVHKLEGHTATVSCVASGRFGTLLSGSWDKTARVWINGASVLELKGHEAAIWACLMMPEQGLMFTASADKTIKQWKTGRCERTYTGHSDCVRGLAVMSDNEFLSCANDSTIRRWCIADGSCVQIYQGHTNYIYSICMVPSGDGGSSETRFATCGEDRTVRVWKPSSGLEQTITMPCQSIWSVAALDNGDIVAGSSDHMCRVFSACADRKASEAAIAEFEEEVSNQAIPAAANLDLGEIKTDQLPGPEALLLPGSKDGQTKLVKRNGVVEAHQWDSSNGRWQKIGDVTGAAGEDGGTRKNNKEIYQGKEYDIIFNVDIQEGQPALKLPFNLTDDPYHAANKFLEDNEISKNYLDEVAKFIIDNTKTMTIGADTSAGYVDPFTGGSRYVAGNSLDAAPPQTGGADPFTGASAYVAPNEQKSTAASGYFPEKNYLKFVSGKSEVIMGKVKEFNELVNTDAQLSTDELMFLARTSGQLFTGDYKLPSEDVDELFSLLSTKLFSWPDDRIFPILDLVRAFVVQSDLSNLLFSDDCASGFVSKLLALSQADGNAANMLLTQRVFANCFQHPLAARAMFAEREHVIGQCQALYKHVNKNLKIAVASVMVNFVVYSRTTSASFDVQVLLCSAIFEMMKIHSDAEPLFRLLVAMGTLLSGEEGRACAEFAHSLDLPSVLDSIREHVRDVQKVGDCASAITTLLDRCKSVR